MKIKIQTMLKHKLQWLLLLAALLGVSQGMWADQYNIVYFAPQASWVSGNEDEIWIRYNMKGDDNEWASCKMKRTGSTYSGRPIYFGLVHSKYDGLGGIYFRKGGDEATSGQVHPFGDRDFKSVGTYAGKVWPDSSDDDVSWQTCTMDSSLDIYFDDTAESFGGASNVYIYYYKGEYWDGSNGSGSSTGSTCFDSGPFAQTSKSGNIYKFTTSNCPSIVAFTKDSQSNYGNFHNNGGAVYSGWSEFNVTGDVTKNTPRLVTTTTYSEKNGTKYYTSSWKSKIPNDYTVSGTATICTGASTNISLSGSEVGYTYKLYKGSSYTSSSKVGTGNSLSFTVSSAGTYTIKAYHTVAQDGETAMSGSATVSVLSNAALTNVSFNNSTICLSGTSTATATGAVLGGGTGAWSYSGSAVASVTNTEASSTVKTSTVTASSSTSGDATITYTITNGCDATAHTKTATISKSATITVNPDASVSGATITFEPSGETCNGNGTRAKIDGVVLGGGTGAWSKVSGTGGSAIDATTGVITGITTGTSGSHRFLYTITGGCGSATKTTDGSVTLGYSPILSPVQKTVKAYEPVSLTCTNANVTWAVNGGETPTHYIYDSSKRSTKFKAAPGTYMVTATNATMTCPGASTIVVEADPACEEP